MRVASGRDLLALLGCLASFGLYPLTNQLATGRAHAVPALPIDPWLPFWPASTVVYVSLYPLLALQWPLLSHTPARRRQLLQALTAANGVGALLFSLLPTSVPRPPSASGWGAGLLRQLWRLDPPHNACPSLHTAFAALTALVHWRTHSHLRWPMTLWALLIVGSTLTTRQHRSLDVLGGASLALALDRWIFRPAIRTG